VERHLGEPLRLSPSVLGDRRDPAVVGGRRGEPDLHGLARLGVRPVAGGHIVVGRRRRGVGRACGQQRAGTERGGAEQEVAARRFRHVCPPCSIKGEDLSGTVGDPTAGWYRVARFLGRTSGPPSRTASPHGVFLVRVVPYCKSTATTMITP